MPCYSRLKNGGNLFVCGGRGPHCNADGCKWAADFLCDYPVGDNKTCDRTLCDEHAYEVAPDMHYCAAHHTQWVDFKNGGGVKRELENVVPYKTIEQQENSDG
jgi:hypothetical protein